MTLRERDKASIRSFLENNADDLNGRTLDYGCGLRPYEDIVREAGGDYWGWDRADHPGSVVKQDPAWESCVYYGGSVPTGLFDAIICNQVVQYLPHPEHSLSFFRNLLKPGGVLLMTGPTNWPIVEKEDLWRFTPAGIFTLIHRAGFDLIDVEAREEFEAEGETRWIIGWQARAVA